MKIFLPNSAHLQNIDGFLRHYESEPIDELIFGMHNRWVSVHPAVLAMTACAGELVKGRRGRTTGEITQIRSLPYLIRMGLFKHLELDPQRTIKEHEESGRFIPLTQIRTTSDLRDAITNLVPLLHAPKQVADPIRYVFSEMVRNALEHSGSPIGAFVCAQYFKTTERISIGIADAGVGIRESMIRSHKTADDKTAISLALQPGITGVTSRIGGNEFNAGAGLFFTKSIAALSRNYFVLYSGESLFKLLKRRDSEEPELHADPRDDKHRFVKSPAWRGTLVGIDIKVDSGAEFSDLLDAIGGAYSIDVKARKKQFHKQIRFTK